MQEALERVVPPLLARMDAALGPGYSAVLYGSAARGEYLPGLSDLNLLLVCDRLDPAVLRRLSEALSGLRSERQPPPLLFERGEWERASDVFPIEITDMQLAHEALRGPDALAPLRVERGDLRRALEQELRARLLRLRQAFALQAADPAALGAVAAQSIASVATLLRVALQLLDGPVSRSTPDVLTAAETRLGLPAGAVAELWPLRRREDAECSAERFERYLAAVAGAVHVIDQLTGGSH
jgi:predicted nucleotidyltransferase